MTSTGKVLVVGGGIAGLVAAVALCRGDFDVEVVEVNPRWDVYGVGIIQQANALRALNAIGLADQCVAAGYPMAGARFLTSQGHVMFEVPQPALAGPQFPPANGITRPRLHAILQQAVREARADIRLGLTVARIEEDGDRVDVAFTDGSSGQYDLVIGADGLRSTVRKLVFGEEHQPTYAGQVCWRCNVPRLPEVETAWLFRGSKGNAGFIPMSPELMYIFLTDTTPPGEPWPRVPQERLATTFRERLAEFGGPVAEIRDRHITDSSQVVLRPFEGFLMPPPWHRGRVVLIGDAAHSMTAHIAQGAAMAIEDAIVLAEELTTRASAPEAFERYMERRYERCKAMVEISLQMSTWEQTGDPNADPGGATGRSFAIAAQPV